MRTSAGGAETDSQATVSLGAILKGTGTINGPAYRIPEPYLGETRLAPCMTAWSPHLSAGSVLHIGINSSSSIVNLSVCQFRLVSGQLADRPRSRRLSPEHAQFSLRHPLLCLSFRHAYGNNPEFKLSYLPAGAPTVAQFELLASHFGTANGTGTIFTRNNQASFSFNVSDNNKKGTPSGTLTYRRQRRHPVDEHSDYRDHTFQPGLLHRLRNDADSSVAGQSRSFSGTAVDTGTPRRQTFSSNQHELARTET